MVLAMLSVLNPFSIGVFFPSMRAMQSEFGIDALTVQQLLTAYMIPYAAMSLVHGALSDALGRRTVVLTGLGTYVLVSLGSVMAQSFEAILAFRAVQGLTAGVGITVGRAVIRDLYDGREAQRLMSFVTILFGIAPAVAPVVGGWVHVLFGWRGVFAFLGTLSLLQLLMTWLLLPETHPIAARRPLHFRFLVRTSMGILANPRFHWLALCNGLLFATLWFYIGSAPAIVIDAWGRSETEFAYLFVPVIAGYMLGALISGRMAGRHSGDTQLRLSLVVTILAAVLATSVSLVPGTPIPAQQFAMGLIALGVQLGAPILTLRALDLYPDSRGAVSSLLAFVQLTAATVVLGIAPLLGRSLALICGCSLATALFAVGCARRFPKRA